MSDAAGIAAAVGAAVAVTTAVFVLRSRRGSTSPASSRSTSKPSAPATSITPETTTPPAGESSSAAAAPAVTRHSAPAPTSTSAPVTPATSAVEVPAADAAVVLTPVEQPLPARGRMRGLVERLGRSNTVFGGALMTLLVDDSTGQTDWETVEDTLIMADLGVGPAQELVASLRRTVKPGGGVDAARAVVREQLLQMLNTATGRDLNLRAPSEADGPQVVLMVGVNGTGKTTTTGKLARMLSALGYRVHLAAADTFRAAAAEQLQTWADRVGASITRKDAGADPAAVAFEAVQHGIDTGADIVLIDTAGRLHTKSGLMDELGKVVRVVQRLRPISEVLLVLDATTGQNGLAQARVFAEVAEVTGVVLTKLDGTAKGGVVVAVQRELGVPVKLVGLGEGADDLADFEPAVFVDALLA